MIDPGATHNFISLKTVEELGLPVKESGGFRGVIRQQRIDKGDRRVRRGGCSTQ